MGWFARGQQSVGLDIGSRYVKVVQVNHARGAPEVSRIGMRALTESDNALHAAVPVVEAVVELFAQAGLKGRAVVTGVGGQDVIVKRIELRRMRAAELREVIRWEAEEHLPFDPAHLELDFRILTSGDPMDVLLVAAKRDLVRSTMEVARSAGLAVEVVDVDGFALYNALAHNHPEAAEGVVVVADIGWETTTIVVAEESVPAVARDLPFGVRSMSDAIQRKAGLEPRAAEAMTRGRRVTPEFTEVVEFAADEIAMGLERASAFLKTRSSDLGMGRIYLGGGGARIPGLAEALGRILSVETHVANPFERVPVRPDAFADLELEAVAPMLLLPVGLALRSSARSRNR